MSIRCCWLLALLGVFFLSTEASAHPVFMKALKAKYDFTSVTCFTCHAKKQGQNPLANAPNKTVRNSFGKLFEPHLEGKDIGARAEEATAAKKSARDAEVSDAVDLLEKAERIEAGLSKDFLQALEKVEAMKDKSGQTYSQLLKSGEVEGVHLPK